MRAILLIGQIPPPFHGQSIMIETLLNNLRKESELSVYHLPFEFSKDIEEIGRFSVRKLLTLFSFLIRLNKFLLTRVVDYVYYPPTGISLSGLYRDLVVLFFIRRIYSKKVVFHFHAMGLSQNYQRSNQVLKLFFRLAIFSPDISVYLSQSNSKELSFIKPKRTKVINNGIDDFSKDFSKKKVEKNKLNILFCGNLIESKGCYKVLEICSQLRDEGLSFSLDFIGGWTDQNFKKKVMDHPFYHNEDVKFSGVLTGHEKFSRFFSADIFFFPSKYEDENFPVVLLEAMCFSLPIVSTNWRSIPEIVSHDENGFLCDFENEYAMKGHVHELLMDDMLRMEMSKKSRKAYEERFTSVNYVASFRKLFCEY